MMSTKPNPKMPLPKSAVKRIDSFRRKIKSPEELAAILGGPPRKKKVVMCHGTFDIVHPGHLRHLMYAKERADILIASLTCDAHITKANHRPFVPQDLRAINLAALEFVDYVVIDKNEVPLENIGIIKPDLFAKGFDYFQGGIPKKTQDEIAAIESYGGEILFTPGDVVYSSSFLIENSPPKLGEAKLYMLMESEKVSFDDLRNAVRNFGNARVHVVGDTIVDSYTYCRPTGGVSKTPTLSVQYERQVNFAGGAAIVAKHLRTAGADVVFSTVLGDDEWKDFIIEDMLAAGVRCKPIIDKTRPTTNKNSIIANGYHLLRLGKVDNRVISDKIRDQLGAAIQSSKQNAIVFSDFRHGIFNRATVPFFSAKVPKQCMRIGDSQVASRWGNILEFQDFDLITPNEREARFALGDQDTVVRPLALELYRKAKCKNLILTLGERGVMTYRSDRDDMRDFFTIDSFPAHVVDAVGAGDALLSFATLGLVTTGNIVISSILGSFAAALACEREGNVPITPEDMLAKIDAVEKTITFS